MFDRRRYNLIHSEHTVEIGRGEKSTFRVGIAQIGLSQHGDILHEFYEKKDSGLFGLKQDKVQPLLLKVEGMIELALMAGPTAGLDGCDQSCLTMPRLQPGMRLNGHA